MTHESNDKSIQNTHNLARFFTEQKHIAWVSLVVAPPVGSVRISS